MKDLLTKEPYKYANVLGRRNNIRVRNEMYVKNNFFILISNEMLIPSDENPENLIEDMLQFAGAHTEMQVLEFAGIPRRQYELLSLWGEVLWKEFCYLYVYEDKNPYEVDTVHGIYKLDRLRLEDAPMVFEYYAFKEDGIGYIESIIENEKSFCARVNSEPVSWVVQREDGSMGIMYTREEHRKKGLGEWLTKHLVNAILSEGELPYLHIWVENFPSIRLAESLNFLCAGEIVWFGVKNPMGE